MGIFSFYSMGFRSSIGTFLAKVLTLSRSMSESGRGSVFKTNMLRQFVLLQTAPPPWPPLSIDRYHVWKSSDQTIYDLLPSHKGAFSLTAVGWYLKKLHLISFLTLASSPCLESVLHRFEGSILFHFCRPIVPSMPRYCTPRAGCWRLKADLHYRGCCALPVEHSLYFYNHRIKASTHTRFSPPEHLPHHSHADMFPGLQAVFALASLAFGRCLPANLSDSIRSILFIWSHTHHTNFFYLFFIQPNLNFSFICIHPSSIMDNTINSCVSSFCNTPPHHLPHSFS